jgi:peptide/nickel transport system permease protein
MSATVSFVVRRTAVTIPVLLVLTVLVFLLVHLVPGDPVRTMLGFHATPANVAAARAEMGLDRPLPEQYWTWFTGLFQGDLGHDMVSDTPVATLIGTHLPVTLELTLAAMILGVLLGVSTGMVAAAAGGLPRKAINAGSLLGLSMPQFWLGIMLALVFADKLNALPPSGYVALTENPVDNLRYLTLPVLTLAIVEAAYLCRVTRAIGTDALRGPSVAFLRTLGLSNRAILFRHVLRQASPPIVTVIGVEVGVLLGGAVVLENIFGLPGLGSLVVKAVQARDYTVVQGCVLVISVLFVLATLLADLAVAVIDPRAARAR